MEGGTRGVDSLNLNDIKKHFIRNKIKKKEYKP